jgi:Flp pilus assembly protein TadG
MAMRNLKSEKGTALLETALTLPLLLAVAVGIFEFGRAYQTWQVLTNAAREGARVAVVTGGGPDAAKARAAQYMKSGQLPNADSATVNVTAATVDIGGGATAPASMVTVSYPFQFVALGPVVQLMVKGSTKLNDPMTMTTSAVMRNE